MIATKTGKNRLHQYWTAEEEQYLLEHYSTKATEKIASALGRSIIAVEQKAHRMKTPKISCPMDKALTPAQCRAMRRFLGVLLRAHDKNPDLNIGTFMTAYRKYIAGREMLLYDVI